MQSSTKAPPENHPPALSTDIGCAKCYRGRVLTDIALGTPVEFDKRTYGATWLKCECTKDPIYTWVSANLHMLEALGPFDIVRAWEEHRLRAAR